MHLELSGALEAESQVTERWVDGEGGFFARRVALLNEAAQHLALALELAPDDVKLRLDYARLLLEKGDTAEGVLALRELVDTHPSAETAIALGRALTRGAVADFAGAVEAYQLAVKLEPNDRFAVSRLNALSLRTMSWAGWDNLVARQEARHPDEIRATLFHDFKSMFRGELSQDAAADLISRLRDLVLQTPVDPGLLYAVSMRLQTMGEFRLGFEAKRLLALASLNSAALRRDRVAGFRAWASAMVSLGHAGLVIERYRPYPFVPKSEKSRIELDIILADAHFSLANPVPLAKLAQRDVARDPSPADDRMTELVTGRRVAIVGPATPSGNFGNEIDEFDVVIRPRFTRDFVRTQQRSGGSRTDITYYSGSDATVLREETGPAIEAGELQLVVTRPQAIAALSQLAANAPWLRFYRRDYSLILRGVPLGITRILYDLLQFSPAEVKLYNVDYFTGGALFANGYRPEHHYALAPGAPALDIFRVHDLLADFEIHRNLFAAGILTGSPDVAAITALTGEQYLARLETSWAARKLLVNA